MLKKIGASLKLAAFLISAASLAFLAIQVNIAKSEFEARSRPYLSIESIRTEDMGDDWIPIMIGVINRGELPATSVQLEKIRIGGEQITWKSYSDVDDPRTVMDDTLVIAPERLDFPSDIIFYPNKLNTIEIAAHGTTWRNTITEGSIMDIGLTYTWGSKQYWYIATTILSNGEWNINLERGD